MRLVRIETLRKDIYQLPSGAQARRVRSGAGVRDLSPGVLALYENFGNGKMHLLATFANAVTTFEQAYRFASVISLFEALQERILMGAG